MSDEAVYARRARIAMQLRSVVESITCSPDEGVKFVMKTDTTYELVGKDWICTRKGPMSPSGKPSIARSFVGRTMWQLGHDEEAASVGEEGSTSACSDHPRNAQEQTKPCRHKQKAPER
ncbi:MAG: hypothetical protein Q8O35_13815 [Humidesulfovibrio sp.]|uniref:hypothetical protein n=1 Tax=Humidesulfovibrio sp. TaxID=2910988 RepID=UPI002733F686|nr:hypothetical protein [Humidesulfovibrio sp.]MDP2849245.1 hypothetical protein [Humidesulfovibrio sp.]